MVQNAAVPKLRNQRRVHIRLGIAAVAEKLEKAVALPHMYVCIAKPVQRAELARQTKPPAAATDSARQSIEASSRAQMYVQHASSAPSFVVVTAGLASTN